MRSSKTLIALSLLAVAALTATPALAQTCGGLASYSSAPWRSGANGVFSGDMTALTADISYGTNNFFGGLGLGLNNYDGMDGSGVALGLAGGYELTAGQKKNIHICPGVQLAHVFGPNDINSSGSNFSQTNITLGGAVGVVATRAGNFVSAAPPRGATASVQHQPSIVDQAVASASRLGGFRRQSALLARCAAPAARGRTRRECAAELRGPVGYRAMRRVAHALATYAALFPRLRHKSHCVPAPLRSLARGDAQPGRKVRHREPHPSRVRGGSSSRR